MAPGFYDMLVLARQVMHVREMRKSFVTPEELTTGVPLSLQSASMPLTPSFAQPLPQTPPLQKLFWTDSERELAKTQS